MRVVPSRRTGWSKSVVTSWVVFPLLMGGLNASGARAQEAGPPRGLIVSTPESAPGYVYYSPLISSTTYLIETVSGDVVHTWESDYAPAGGLYLLDNGNLLRTAREPDVSPFSGGGQGGRIQEITWNGELTWDYVFASEEHLLHHDVELLPNGNVLAIAWEAKTLEEVQRMGHRPEMTPEGGLWPDMVIELEPVRPDGARIVWEWHAWDHMIQDHDPSRGNYADPSEHPELIDVNAGRPVPDDLTTEQIARYRTLGYVPSDDEHSPSADHSHMNAVAYNAELDQIALSNHEYHEIWIIDHSTTTEEARGHTGGRWGRGGDLLYRWGNPQTYGRGGEPDRRLGGQHDIRWIPEGFAGAGNLLLFNNNTPPQGTHSTVYELEPPLGADGRYVIREGDAFGPPGPTWSYAAPEPTSFHSPFISGARRLPDGHTLITSGGPGRFLEVTSAGEIVWEFRSPTSGDVRMPDGSLPHPVEAFPYAVFRATKIGPDHPALRGRALVPLDPQPQLIPPPQGR